MLGLLNSAVAAYYYLRILVVMYMKEPGEATLSLPAAGRGHQELRCGSRRWERCAGDLPVAAAELRHQFQRAGEVDRGRLADVMSSSVCSI